MTRVVRVDREIPSERQVFVGSVVEAPEVVVVLVLEVVPDVAVHCALSVLSVDKLGLVSSAPLWSPPPARALSQARSCRWALGPDAAPVSGRALFG